MHIQDFVRTRQERITVNWRLKKKRTSCWINLPRANAKRRAFVNNNELSGCSKYGEL